MSLPARQLSHIRYSACHGQGVTDDPGDSLRREASVTGARIFVRRDRHVGVGGRRDGRAGQPAAGDRAPAAERARARAAGGGDHRQRQGIAGIHLAARHRRTAAHARRLHRAVRQHQRQRREGRDRWRDVGSVARLRHGRLSPDARRPSAPWPAVRRARARPGGSGRRDQPAPLAAGAARGSVDHRQDAARPGGAADDHRRRLGIHRDVDRHQSDS